MIEYIPGELWGKMLPSIDNSRLYNTCLETEKLLFNTVVDEDSAERYGSKTTAVYWKYNIFTSPQEPYQDLYHKLVEVIKPVLPNETHVIQGWLNVFREGENIKWHTHWEPEYRAIHGFYCVNVTPSFTEYRYDSTPDVIHKIESKEGLLVFGKSNGDEHQSSPWHDPLLPRITIAFDIIPITTLDRPEEALNHLIPF